MLFRSRQAARLLTRAQAIDTTGLADGDRLDQQLLVRALTDRLEAIRLRNHEMPIEQMSGVHPTLPQIATVAPFDSDAHYRDYIARLDAIPAAIEQVIERARAGMKDGLIQPRVQLEKTVAQCAALAEAAGADSPFAEPAARIPASFPSADRRQLRAAIIAAVPSMRGIITSKITRFGLTSTVSSKAVIPSGANNTRQPRRSKSNCTKRAVSVSSSATNTNLEFSLSVFIGSNFARQHRIAMTFL